MILSSNYWPGISLAPTYKVLEEDHSVTTPHPWLSLRTHSSSHHCLEACQEDLHLLCQSLQSAFHSVNTSLVVITAAVLARVLALIPSSLCWPSCKAPTPHRHHLSCCVATHQSLRLTMSQVSPLPHITDNLSQSGTCQPPTSSKILPPRCRHSKSLSHPSGMILCPITSST